jgi:DNA (cytosine-5)-methyltransferase 1
MADPQQHGRGRQTKPACDKPQESNGPTDKHGGCSGSSVRDMADASDERRERNAGKLVKPKPLHEGKKPVVGGSSQETFDSRSTSFWSNHNWLTGADGKSRRAKPGLPLLAHGIPNRVGRLRAYGNAIVPQVAAEVIKAFMETAQVRGRFFPSPA